MIVDIEKIVVKNRIRKDFGDIKELADDIKQNGLINPPTINKEYELLAGERRVLACKSLGWKQIEVRMMDTRDAEHELNIEISENDVRKGFSKAERVDYMKRLLEVEQAKAKERMAESGGNISTPTGKSRDIVSEQFGISGKTMEREISIVDNAKLLTPEDFVDWDEGRLSTNKAYQKIKAQLAEKNRIIRELENREPELPDDYVDMKLKLKSAVINAERAEKDFEKIRKENDKLRKEKKQLEERIGEDEQAEKITRSALFFCAGVSNFIEKYGGYVWLTQELDNMSPEDRKGYVDAVNAVYAWASQMKANIGE